MDRALDRIRLHDLPAGLVGKEIDGVRGVVPQQVVGPRPRLTQGVGVRAAEEVRLHVHLLEVELAGPDLVVDPLMAGIEAARMSDHGHLARLLLRGRRRFGTREAVGQRNLHLHVLAGGERRDRLVGVHLRGRAQDDGVHLLHGERLRKVGACVADAVLLRHLLRLVELAADDRHDPNARNVLDAVEVLGPERARAGQRHVDRLIGHCAFSRMRWPTAVFDAGT